MKTSSQHHSHPFPQTLKIGIIVTLGLLCALLLYSAANGVFAFAEDPTKTVVDTQGNEITVPAPTQTEEPNTPQGTETASDNATNLSSVDNCSITLEYFEIVNYDDPDKPVSNGQLHLMGTRTLDGFHEGDIVDAWTYVVDIPGHFFWDGWPAKLTVSRDPSQNVITLHYAKLWNSEYTVNYYIMTGADLTADTWTEALAPEGVAFTKIGSETFTNQRFDALIKGDAYEYKIDNMYVIDSYPAEIRLGTDPDNNVINVLYTPDLTTLPDEVEVTDKIPNYDDLTTTLPDELEIPDEQFSYDDLITTLPDDVVVEDFASTDTIDPDEETTIDVTDEMLANPVNKADAEKTINAYITGSEQAKALSQTGDTTGIVIAVIAGIAILAAIVIVAIMRRRNQ